MCFTILAPTFFGTDFIPGTGDVGRCHANTAKKEQMSLT